MKAAASQSEQHHLQHLQPSQDPRTLPGWSHLHLQHPKSQTHGPLLQGGHVVMAELLVTLAMVGPKGGEGLLCTCTTTQRRRLHARVDD